MKDFRSSRCAASWLAMLKAFQTFCFFTGRNSNERRFKSGPDQRFVNRLGKFLTNVCVRDDGAAISEFQARAFDAELLQKAARDFNFVAAISKLNGNDAHVRRIKIATNLRNKKARAKLHGL